MSLCCTTVSTAGSGRPDVTGDQRERRPSVLVGAKPERDRNSAANGIIARPATIPARSAARARRRTTSIVTVASPPEDRPAASPICRPRDAGSSGSLRRRAPALPSLRAALFRYVVMNSDQPRRG
jgi:hypothetical protein